MKPDSHYMATGRPLTRLRSILFLLPAWFAPHKSLRVFFHRLRGVKVGRHVEIGYYCIIGNVHPHMVEVCDGAVVTANCVLLEHDNSMWYAHEGEVRFGPVRIGRKAFLGIGTIVLPNVTIGDRTIVGANSVVTRSLPGGCIAAGSPAKIVRWVEDAIPAVTGNPC